MHGILMLQEKVKQERLRDASLRARWSPTREPPLHPAAAHRRAGRAVRQLGPPDALGALSPGRRVAPPTRPACPPPARSSPTSRVRGAPRGAADAEERPAPRRRREPERRGAARALRRRGGRVDVVWGETTVYVDAARVREIVQWLHDDPAALRLPRRRDRGGVPRGRAPARGGVAPALAAVPPLPAAQGRAPQGPAARGAERRAGLHNSAPNWLERECYDMFGVALRGAPRPAAHPDVGDVPRGAPAAEGLPAARPLQPRRAAAAGAHHRAAGALLDGGDHGGGGVRAAAGRHARPPGRGSKGGPAERAGPE
jgi:hypothetical protein